MSGPEGEFGGIPLNIEVIVAARIAKAVELIDDYYDVESKRLNGEIEKVKTWQVQVQSMGKILRKDQALEHLEAQKRGLELGYENVLQALGLCEKIPDKPQ